MFVRVIEQLNYLVRFIILCRKKYRQHFCLLISNSVFFFSSAFHNNYHKGALQVSVLQASKPGKDNNGK